MPMADSGVPNAGLPDCISVLVRNDPYTLGVPGRISWTKAIPARASAVCCATVPARPIGDIAPAMRHGVTLTGLPAAEYSISPPSMRSPERSVLLTVMRLRAAGPRAAASSCACAAAAEAHRVGTVPGLCLARGRRLRDLLHAESTLEPDAVARDAHA